MNNKNYYLNGIFVDYMFSTLLHFEFNVWIQTAMTDGANTLKKVSFLCVIWVYASSVKPVWAVLVLVLHAIAHRPHVRLNQVPIKRLNSVMQQAL